MIRYILTLLIIRLPRWIEYLKYKPNNVSQSWIDENKKRELDI